MPGILTDAHISPRVAAQVRAKRPECQIHSLRLWRGGELLDAEDDLILAAALEAELTLVTYDQRTIVPLVTQWMVEGRDHSGVAFLDENSILQEDIGGQVLAIVEMWDAGRCEQWPNSVMYLRQARTR
ncbi:MAG TPA: DUF5615 family PIN-like protein [Chthonomonadaceae bacterium]|nr:DUF5615 family PIN-like protein [Chthonomonadaceae bacterium]